MKSGINDELIDFLLTVMCALNSLIPPNKERAISYLGRISVCVCVCVCVCERCLACCVLSVPDQGECAVCSPPQAVAQVMIQSFQLSSCALFNAQMQDVSPPPPPSALFLSASGPYLDVSELTCQDSL